MTLSTNQELAIRDDRGRLRCPSCQRYRRLEDFPDQQAHVRVTGPGFDALVAIAPRCGGCLAKERA